MSILVGEPIVAMSATAGIVGRPGAVDAVGVGAKQAPVGGDAAVEAFRQEGDVAALGRSDIIDEDVVGGSYVRGGRAALLPVTGRPRWLRLWS